MPLRAAATRRARLALSLCASLGALLLWAGSALAGGGTYSFVGGAPRHHDQVRAALEASSFDWSLVPGRVTVHIVPGVPPLATPGEIWLDSGLLEAGVFSWAIVQDEYAHQIDFLLLDDRQRQLLNALLGGRVWCHADLPGLPHSAYGCERFTSTFVWAYWPHAANAYRPLSRNDEAAAMEPARFRALVGSLLLEGDDPPAAPRRLLDSY